MNTKRHATARQKKTLLQSTLFLFFAITPFLVSYPTPVTLAATFTVNSTVDAVDATPGDGVCDDGTGNCTLRAAIQETNALSGADTITLPAGTYIRTLGLADPANSPTTNPDASGDLDITDDLTITGAGEATTIIDAAGIDRVFHVLGGTVSITDVRIQGGNPPGGCVADFFPSACSAGGGICVKGGTVTVTDSRITGNSGCQGAGAEIGTTLILNSVAVSGNNGRGLQGNGGGSMTLINSTVSGNSDFGIFENGGATLINTTISSNGDTGVFSAFGPVNLNNVTITNNPSGLRANSGVSPFNMKNTILAGNTNDCYPFGFGTPTINSQGYNLIQNTAGCIITGDTTGNQTAISPNLGPLQDNGGLTFTHALPTGSPAIDAGNPDTPGSGGNACAADDQRGVARPQDGDGDTLAVCDIGSYEFEATCQPVTETCNGVDDDCDETVDEGFNGLGTQCTVGIGTCQRTGTTVCTANEQGTECDATPGTPGTEVCNGADDNCDGQTDEGLGTISCGVGACAQTVNACVGGQSQTCTPGTPSTEVCDGQDNNCDGQTDEGVQSTFYRDVDGDGFGTSTNTIQACSAPAGYVINNTDCNDGNAAIYPGAVEVCNGVDDNCNGRVNETFAGLGRSCSVGVGTCQSSGTRVCSADGTAVVCSAVPGTPGTEICGNSIDEDCNGADLICAPPPSLTVTTPNGGERWRIGQSRTLKWKSTSVSGNVTIELSRNNGGTWVTLFPSTPNDGQENWVITGPATTLARIRISSVTSPSVVDVSDAVFTIR